MEDDFDSQKPRGLRGWWTAVQEQGRDAYQTSPLLRHFIHEPLFFVTLLLILGAGLGLGIMVPKVWNPAPPDFSKHVRVSLLDYVQTWSLRRAGDRAAQEGKWEEALASYRAAIANNLADLPSLRGLLTVLRDSPSPSSSNLRTILLTGELARELGRTNRADALLLADVFERHRIADLAFEALRPWEKELSPTEDLVWTRALLTSGRVNEFRARIQTDPGRFATDPILAIYQAALEAGWGSLEPAMTGMERLRAALKVPAHQAIAARLLMAAALQRGNLAEYQTGLEALRAVGATMAQDEAVGWEMLARAGRRDEAIELAKAYDKVPPPTAVEAVQLARTWLGLGLADLALAMFKDHAERYGQSLEVWATYFDLLMLKGDWNEVRRVASGLRVTSSVRNELLPVTLYADIRADLAENRRITAQDSLQRLASFPITNPRLTLRFAAGLNSAGEPQTALRLLTALEAHHLDSTDYWLEVVLCTRALKDAPGMLRASERLAELAPGNPTAQTIRLVTLLGTREQPTEALAISLRLLQAGTPGPSTVVNHAMALLLNRRAEEAKILLDSLPPERLTAEESNSWRIALTDALAQRGNFAAAARTGKDVDTSALLPPQAAWFRDLLADCGRKATATAPPP